MGVKEDKLDMLNGIFEEQRALTDDEMQVYKDMLRRKEIKATESGFNQTMRKDQATLIAELISRVTSLEEDMEFVLKHIKIIELDRQIEVISPSWDMRVKNYEMPSGAKATFEYDEDGVGKISLEAMDRLMELAGAKEIYDDSNT